MGEKLQLLTTKDKITYKNNRLRYKGQTREYKQPAFEACYFEIKPTPWMFDSGETTIKVSSI